MKKRLFVVILYLASVPVFSQGIFSEFMNKDLALSVVTSGGYVFSNDAVKVGISFNNFYKRFGAYTSYEASTTGTPSFHIIGGTFGITDEFYAWAGLDLFTNHGLFKQGLNGRKEMGLAYAPIPNLVIMPGYSFSVGFTIQAGLRIPLQFVKPSHQDPPDRPDEMTDK